MTLRLSEITFGRVSLFSLVELKDDRFFCICCCCVERLALYFTRRFTFFVAVLPLTMLSVVVEVAEMLVSPVVSSMTLAY